MDKEYRKNNILKQGGFIRRVAWFNIVLQAFFPIAGSMVPVISARANNEIQSISADFDSRWHIIQKNESLEYIAKKYGSTVNEIKENNLYFVSAENDMPLTVGSKLLIPPKNKWLNSPNHQNESQIKENQLANIATQAGRFLQNNPNRDSAVELARSVATRKVNAGIEQWFRQFGHARVQLNTDKNFSLKGSQFDLLFPLWDQKENLVFNQTSLHRADNRTQANLGIGWRHFEPGYMLGSNAFFDYDLSRRHARAGLGVEYWRDYLKLSANSYFRLSGWKDSPDFEDYQERPANGWDIRAEGYLPQYPQLGAKLAYEQYYGDQVALFGKENRQSQPHAFTAGLTYTPVPLITIGAEKRQGKSGKNEDRLNLQINYQFGVPWRQQISSDAVSRLRSLANNRYGLVDRNNHIVLEYQKKEVIWFHLDQTISGYAGEEKPLNISVSAKYGLERIDWELAELTANGGKIENDGGHYRILLPDYQYSHTDPTSVAATGDHKVKNTYSVSAVAIDKKGNRSNPVHMQVIVSSAAINTANSLFSPEISELAAEGKSTQKLTLTIKDKMNQPVDVNVEEITLKIESSHKTRGSHSSQVSDFQRIAVGQYAVTVTAGTRTETLTLTPFVRNQALAATKITVKADVKTAHISENQLTIEQNSAKADGQSENRIQLVVNDEFGNPVPDYEVMFSSDDDVDIGKSAITDKNGIITMPVKSEVAGSKLINITVGEHVTQAEVIFVADSDTASIQNSDLTITPAFSVADGQTEQTITAKVTDKQGNPVSNIKVIFEADNQAVIATQEVITDEQGIAQTTMTSLKSGTVMVTGTVNHNQNQTQGKTELVGHKATALIKEVKTENDLYVADGKTSVTVSAVVTDENGNPLQSVAVDWKSNRDSNSVEIHQSQSFTDENGIARTTVTSKKAYEVQITASTNATSGTSTPILFKADPDNGEVTDLSQGLQHVASSGSKTEISTKITDQFGNPLPGVEVRWRTDSPDAHVTSTSITDENGKASTELEADKAGDIKVWASLSNGKEISTEITIVADQQTAVVTLASEGNKMQAVADDQDSITLIAKVVDANQNPLQGIPVTWHSLSAKNKLRDNVSDTNDAGEARNVISGTRAGTTTIEAVLQNKGKKDLKVTFTAIKLGENNVNQDDFQINSSFKLVNQSIVADGSSKAQAILVLKDKYGNPVPGYNQKIAYSSSNNSSITFHNQQESEPGIYTVLIAGKQEGTFPIDARLGQLKFSDSLGFVANQTTAEIDTVTVLRTTALQADGLENVTIQAQVKDSNGNTALPGVYVGWQTSSGTLSSPLSPTNEKGIAEITLSSRQAGNARVTAVLGSGQKTADNPVTFIAGGVSGDKSSLEVSKSIAVTDEDIVQVKVIARDEHDNLLTGLQDKIAIRSTSDLQITDAPVFKEIEYGIYVADIKGKIAGDTQLIAEIGSTGVKQQAELTLTGNSKTAKPKDAENPIDVTSNKIIAGNSVTYSITLMDSNGNPLGKGIPVFWSADAASTLLQQMTTTDEQGVAQVTLHRDKAGTAKVTALLSSGGQYLAPAVEFTPADIDPAHSTFMADKRQIGSDAKEQAILTVKLADKFGNAISGKTVNIHLPNLLEGFVVTPTPMQDNGDGTYSASATAKNKGSQEIQAAVEGKSIGQSLTVSVGAITPDLRFANATQQATYTKRYAHSQKVVDGGIPTGIRQMWTSSADDVATVDDSGNVTLWKAGTATITVQTGTNGQYHSAKASYTLEVKKAAPQLQHQIKQIVAAWNDGKNYAVTPSFANQDVDAQALLQQANFSSHNNGVVKVDKQGNLSMVKPGNTTITIKTPETNQFTASTADVAYVLNKGKVDISFDEPVVQGWVGGNSKIQQPFQLPVHAKGRWESGNKEVIEVSRNGLWSRKGTGSATMTLYVEQNDYYMSSHGSYNVELYDKPEVDIKSVEYPNEGKLVSMSSSENWTPAFTDDGISITWNALNSNKYKPINEMRVQMEDANSGKLLDYKDYTYQEISSSKLHKTTFVPKPEYFGISVRIKLTARGFIGLNTVVSSNNLPVRHLEPDQIWSSVQVRSRYNIVAIFLDHSEQKTCQGNAFNREHSIYVDVIDGYIDFGGKKLLVPMHVSYKATIRPFDDSPSVTQDLDKANLSGNSYKEAYQAKVIDGNDSSLLPAHRLIHSNCWDNHSGGYRMNLNVKYAGKEYKYVARHSYGYGGNGDGVYDSDGKRVINIDNKFD
ncbi:Ig-like domain-containing protein [Xenorhabdus bovienii]|uniref:Ig-like domain-containing protein n=1 Tax=Xenorhabdus bovienii TaxID=40576 RepID=UPI0023B30792|nr:Ig-like domain-containing protein [Xenorhabdus bovienii]MDE9566171.1 Ig-like domain-containing protein [Xenorhabdus bovienii]